MGTLSDIPNEIINAICTILRDDYAGKYDCKAKGGLYSLCLASRRCYDIALPHLYYSILTNIINPALFGLTVLSNQKLANLVHTWTRRVHLYYLYGMDSEAKQATRARFLQHASSSEEDGDENAFNDQLTCTVFTKLPNIERLEITVHFGKSLHRRLESQITPHVPVLPNLKEVSLSHWDSEGGFHLDEVFPLLATTRVPKVNIWMCAGFGDYGSTWDLSSVIDIDIGYSCLEYPAWRQLVQCCPKLEKLAYATGDSAVSQYTDGEASSCEISRAIQPLSGTLRSLTIDQRERCERDLGGDTEPIDSLKSFLVLEHLKIWQLDLTKEEEDDDEELEEGFHEEEAPKLQPWAQKLPQYLEILHIIGVTDAIIPELRRLAELAAEEYPVLKEVVVDKELDLDVFQAKGIDFRAVKAC